MSNRRASRTQSRNSSSGLGPAQHPDEQQQQQQQQQQQPLYDFSVHGAPTFAGLEVRLRPGEKLLADGGALSYMREGVQRPSAKLSGGLLKAVGRAIGGEQVFLSEYEALPGAQAGAATAVVLSTPFPGDIMTLDMRAGDAWVLSRGAYLAGSPNVSVSGKLNWRGAIPVGQEEGLVLPRLECKGADGERGVAWLGAYGRFQKHVLASSAETLLVDNGMFLACKTEAGRAMYKIVKLGRSWASSLFTGEGFGMEFAGPCTVYTQSHNFNELVAQISARMPPSSDGGIDLLSGGGGGAGRGARGARGRARVRPRGSARAAP